MERLSRQSKRILIAVVGAVVVLAGIVLIPYPGPGWLIVFAGLAILGTEFSFASRLLEFAKKQYEQWVDWLANQSIWVRFLVLALTGLVIVITLWLVNAYGILAGLFGIDAPWLQSPFIW